MIYIKFIEISQGPMSWLHWVINMLCSINVSICSFYVVFSQVSVSVWHLIAQTRCTPCHVYATIKYLNLNLQYFCSPTLFHDPTHMTSSGCFMLLISEAIGDVEQTTAAPSAKLNESAPLRRLFPCLYAPFVRLYIVDQTGVQCYPLRNHAGRTENSDV